MLAASVSCAKGMFSGSYGIVVTAGACPEDELEEDEEEEEEEEVEVEVWPVEDGLAQG